MPQFRRKNKRGGAKKDKNDAEENAASGEEEEQAAAPDVKEQVATLKEEGNAAFTAGQWETALEKFSEAIRLEPLNHVLYSNRSGTNLQLKRTRDAVSDAQECVTLMPSWAKGYSRLGAALLADKQAVAAKAAYEKGLLIEPANAGLLQGLATAKPAAEEEEVRVVREKVEEEEASKPRSTDPADTVVIGIDLGTTFSCVGVWQHGTVEILEDEGGSRTTPSFVAFTQDGGRLVGEAAKGQAARNVTNTFYDIKRILGQKFSDDAVREEAKRFAFEVLPDDNDDPRIRVPALDGKLLPPEQLSGLVLAHMKRIAERRLGHAVKKAVITVPAYFNDAQRQATKAAGAIAGLQVLRIINEPTAAALAYGLDKKRGETGSLSSNVLIFDLGGGTFDVSILKMEEGLFQVLATGGDTHLGGEDFDNVVVDHLVDLLRKKHSVEAKGDHKMLRKLRTAAERAKRALSNGTCAHIEVEDYCFELTRAKFESLNKANFDRTMDTVRKVLKDAKLDAKEVDELVLVGGSTRIPVIQEHLSEAFGGRQLCKAINPDEAVAYGAAVQGAILSGVRNAATDALLLVDVTPLSLGIETQGKHFSVLIPRNTNIPCKKASTFTTTENYQESIDVCVYEGERPCTDGNRLLGQFTIHNIERAKREEPQIEVSFELDANGILSVSARDKKTGARADTRIEGACKGLDESEISRMVQEAENFAREDELYREQLETKLELEGLVWDILERAEQSGEAESKDVQKAREIQEWLENLTGLGKVATGRQLDNKLRELRG